ncbi:hypothetical protein C8R44DRAFT_831249 [Mycena epipterygia]|nr:hypothetical protein C8R44DRAFT_831249 [Mycena epipterygia]
MRLTFWDFVKGQFTTPKPVLKENLTRKTVLVLGANAGIGFEATKHFATMNPERFILACRSESKGQAAVEKLKAATGYARAELWIIDLANFSSVKQFSDKFERDGGRLDILVENAAIGSLKYEPITDGWETSLQVNCFSTSLLAIRFLPFMIKTAQEQSTSPRIIFVSSGAHHWVNIEKNIVEDPSILQTLGSAEYCSKPGVTRLTHLQCHETSILALKTYASLTHLSGRTLTIMVLVLNVFFFRALNARLPPTTPVIVNATSPGYCYSELRREFSGFLVVIDYIMERLLAWTTEEGSRQLILHGQYIAASKVQEVSDYVLSADGARVEDRVWDDTVAILSKVDPRVIAVVEKYLTHA